MGAKQGAIVEFKSKSSKSAITRPNNTTTYTAGDVIAEATTNNHFVFEEAVSKKGGTSLITNARITSSQNASTKPDAELWLFPNDIAEVGDNVQFAPTDAEMASRIGVMDFAVADWKEGNGTAGAGGNAGCEATNLGIIVEAGLTQSIYGVLVVRNAYAPVADEEFTVEIMTSQD